MDVYIEQLERLKTLEPHLMFPSHGPVIPLPEKTLTITSSIEWNVINVCWTL